LPIMTQVETYTSPLARGVQFTFPEQGWLDLRTLIDGSVRPGAVDGNDRAQPVFRWTSDDGGITAHHPVLGNGDRMVRVDVRRPTTQREAAQLGALLVYAVSAKLEVNVDLALPDDEGSGPTERGHFDLSERACVWGVRRFGSYPHSLIKPVEYNSGGNTALALQATFGRPRRWHDVTPEGSRRFAGVPAPQAIGEGYAETLGISLERGQQVVTDLVGAPDFDTVMAVFQGAGEAKTPFEAAHWALGALLAEGGRP
jgi:hypothetical protein